MMIIRLTDTEIEEEDLYTMVQSLAEGLCNQAGAPFSEVYTAEERAQGSGCGLTGHSRRPETVSET